MNLLKVGVFGTSSKKDEKRVPIHPGQLDWIEEDIRKNLLFEEGYGLRFGIDDEALANQSGGTVKREDLFNQCDVALLPKPVPADFQQMKENGILWGWPHCVQQRPITQIAIDRRLTLIAWEAMHQWSDQGDWQMHTFHRNNEIAGYGGVLHALGLIGVDGNYGPPRKAVVISYGSVSRGAVIGLKSMGFHDVTVFTEKHYKSAAEPIAGVNHHRFEENENGQLVMLHADRPSLPLIEELAQADIIVNGILQDTDHPLTFVRENEIGRLKPGCLVVDISCDEGMGFPFAKPTTFADPMFKVGHIHYYAVDHTPSYLWNSASWEISKSLIPFLPIVMKGSAHWEKSQTIRRAIEIQDGIIKNPKILSFQNRGEDYPHPILAG